MSKASPKTSGSKKGAIKSRKPSSDRRSGEAFATSFQRVLDTLLSDVKQHSSDLPPEEVERFTAKLQALWNYTPSAAIFGQTGSGKSSLCNALFGDHVCNISAVEACTRTPQEIRLEVGKEGILLVDMPGVGESRELDEQYGVLYQEVLSRSDLVLWLLKADARAYASDLHVWNLVAPAIKKARIPYLFVLSQAEKIEPAGEWNGAKNEPGHTQMGNILLKRKSVARDFGVPILRIIPVSSTTGYNLQKLVYEVILALPDEKKSAVLKLTQKGVQSESADRVARKGFFRALWEGTKRTCKKIYGFAKENKEWLIPLADILIAIVSRGKVRRRR